MNIQVPSLEDLLKKSHGRYDEETIRWVYQRMELPLQQLQDKISDYESDRALEAMGLGEKKKETLWQKGLRLLSVSNMVTKK